MVAITGPVSSAGREVVRRPGVLLIATVGLVCVAFAVSVDFPKAAHGFKGDEATYYSLTYSIARDGDFAFQRQDLIRVWEEFPGPEGIFLKRGGNIDFESTSSFPFIRMVRFGRSGPRPSVLRQVVSSIPSLQPRSSASSVPRGFSFFTRCS